MCSTGSETERCCCLHITIAIYVVPCCELVLLGLKVLRSVKGADSDLIGCLLFSILVGLSAALGKFKSWGLCSAYLTMELYSLLHVIVFNVQQFLTEPVKDPSDNPQMDKSVNDMHTARVVIGLLYVMLNIMVRCFNLVIIRRFMKYLKVMQRMYFFSQSPSSPVLSAANSVPGRRGSMSPIGTPRQPPSSPFADFEVSYGDGMQMANAGFEEGSQGVVEYVGASEAPPASTVDEAGMSEAAPAPSERSYQ